MKPYFENETIKILQDSENIFRCFMKINSGLVYLTKEQAERIKNEN